MLKDNQQIEIMEATGRFEFLRHERSGFSNISKFFLVFWDNNFDEEVRILAGVDLPHLMQWITEFFEKDAFESGKEEGKREIRKALDLK